MPADEQNPEMRQASGDFFDNLEIVHDARRGGIANDRANSIVLDSVNHIGGRKALRRSIEQVYLMTSAQRHTGGGREPLREIERAAFGNGGTPLLAGEPGVKGRVKKERLDGCTRGIRHEASSRCARCGQPYFRSCRRTAATTLTEYFYSDFPKNATESCVAGQFDVEAPLRRYVAR
jgi:hypothetical protein